MFKIGLEKEFFVLNGDKPIAVTPGLVRLPRDECGWLAEARGEAHGDIVEAIFSLKAACYRLERDIEAHNKLHGSSLRLSDQPVMKLPKEVKYEAMRHYGKAPIQYRNLYGHICHAQEDCEATAGVHISFTNPKTGSVGSGTTHPQSYTYNAMFDWAFLFMKLDESFGVEINAAKRYPGFYELKYDGRIEYRSLPANVDLDKVYNVLSKLVREGSW